MTNSSERTVQTLDRAIGLLWMFSLDEPELGVTELARRAGLHKSTVSRLLAALERHGMVRQDATSRKYRLGLGVLELAGRVSSGFDLRQLARPYLLELASSTGETVNLGILDGDAVVNIDQIVGTRSMIRHIGWIGRRNPLHCTSSGKVALACMTERERETLLAQPLVRWTAHTITDADALRRAIDEVRRQGYGYARDEFEEGLSAVAAPILGRAGELIAMVGVSGPSFRLLPSRLAELGDRVAVAATAMSDELCRIQPPAVVLFTDDTQERTRAARDDGSSRPQRRNLR